jgi:hypothetical protein
MRLDDALHQRKADADTANPRPLRVSSTDEFLKNTFPFPTRDTGTLIFHCQQNRAPLAPRCHADWTPCRRVFGGILQQVPECTRQRLAVRLNWRKALLDLA